MVSCVLCKPCTFYDRVLEVCSGLHSKEMLGHPESCGYRKVKEVQP